MSYQLHRSALLAAVLTGVLSACSDGVTIDNAATPSDDPTSDDVVNSDNQALSTIPRHDAGFKDSHFSGSDQCSTCHDGLIDESGGDVSLAADWSGSMMANAARDPYWVAKVAAEINRNPTLEDALDDTCSRCHAPMANEHARKEGLDLSILGEQGMLDSDSALFSHAMEGVSCTLCHQIEDNGLLGTVEGVSGQFSIREFEQASQRPAYGQYSDPSGVYMQTQSQFNPVYGPHLSRSETCASCHDLRTPSSHSVAGASDPQASGFFPEQMVFSEWQHSAYASTDGEGRTCQSCHMPVVAGSVMLANQGGGVPREGFARHTFLGANTVMQNLLLQYREELGVNATTEQLSQSIVRNKQFIRGAASVEILTSQRNEQELLVDVNIRNQTGHKLPSGYPSRRAYLHFVVLDSMGVVVFESGRLNDDGSIVGVDTDDDSSSYEQHYDTISSVDQVQVYESIMGQADGTVTHTLLDATEYVKDNRLLPLGFNKLSAPDDVRVVGTAVSDASFASGGDLISYRIANDATGPLTIRAELIYQPLAYGHIQDLFDSAQLEEVARFKTMFESVDLKAEVIDSDTLTIP